MRENRTLISSKGDSCFGNIETSRTIPRILLFGARISETEIQESANFLALSPGLPLLLCHTLLSCYTLSCYKSKSKRECSKKEECDTAREEGGYKLIFLFSFLFRSFLRREIHTFKTNDYADALLLMKPNRMVQELNLYLSPFRTYTI